MEIKRIVSVIAFAILFLSALFLFIRNYPSDREFSVVFTVTGGILMWVAWGERVKSKALNTLEETDSPNVNKLDTTNDV